MKNSVVVFLVLLLFVFCSCGRTSDRRRVAERTNNSQPNSKENRRRTPTQKTKQKPVVPPKENIATKVGSSEKTLQPTEIFDKYNSAVFMVYTSDGYSGAQGSGFFISDDGLAVSNYHVFKGSTKGEEIIKLENDQQYKVKRIISYDDELDYILFQVDIGNQKVNYIPINYNLPKVGEKVYAIGSPKGFENTFSSGEVSQMRGKYLIQISVPIDHGSSGGVLINSYGEAIGITTSGVDDSGANLNFAISINVIK